MASWFDTISATDDFSPVMLAYEHFDREYEDFRKELSDDRLRGQKVLMVAARVPGLSEWAYARWSEINAILDLMEIRKQRALQRAKVKHSIVSLKAEREKNAHAKIDDDVLDIAEIMVRIKLIRDKWEGLSRGVERLHYQLGNIKDVRKAGLDEIML